jgi:hypothetical protein
VVINLFGNTSEASNVGTSSDGSSSSSDTSIFSSHFPYFDTIEAPNKEKESANDSSVASSFLCYSALSVPFVPPPVSYLPVMALDKEDEKLKEEIRKNEEK